MESFPNLTMLRSCTYQHSVEAGPNLTKTDGKEIHNAKWSVKMKNKMAEETRTDDGMMATIFLRDKF